MKNQPVKAIHLEGFEKLITGVLKNNQPQDAQELWDSAITHSTKSNKTMNQEEFKIDRVYCITLNPTDEKIYELNQRFSSFGLNAEFVVWGAVDGKSPKVDFNYNLFQGWKIRSENAFWNREITAGEVGCALSHISIWREAYHQGLSNVLILEEDFQILRPYSPNEFETSQDWTMIYLGRNKVFDDKRQVNEFLVQPDYSYTSHAYLLNREGMKRLIDQNFQNHICAIDELLPATYTQHPRADLRFIWQDTIALALKTDMIGQTSNAQTSTTENSQVAKPNLSEIHAQWKNERLYPELFDTANWDEWKRRWLQESALTKEWSLVVDEPIDNVFTFPLFKEEFCEKLIQEAEHVAKWTKERHQFYPTHDMLLSEFGFQDIYHRILVEYVYPMSKETWHLEGNKWDDLHSENFIIKYDHTIQGHLSLHHDSSVISCVLALNEDYQGGGTYFSKQKKLHKGKTGHISVHPGIITHRHGGRPVEDGQRFIVVSFCNYR